jgi:hypothetical protein
MKKVSSLFNFQFTPCNKPKYTESQSCATCSNFTIKTKLCEVKNKHTQLYNICVFHNKEVIKNDY